MNKTILITGCSTGIGRMTAKYFQEKGWNVAATVRKNPDQDTELNALDNVLVTALDVTKEDTIQSAIKATIDRFGKIDVLLNNAGDGAKQMRYIAGPDAEQIIAARKQMDDDSYMAMMKQQMGL